MDSTPPSTRRTPFPRAAHGLFLLATAAPFLLAAALPLTMAGCGRGEARFGQPCTSDSDCQRGLCVAGVAGDAPVCTTSCGSRGDCPPDWACNGVTQANVVVCSRGASTPFGEGSR